MSRLTRKTVIKAELEPSYGGGGVTFTGASALLVSNPSFRITRDVVGRELVREWLGGSEQLVGARKSEITFDVEMAGAGAPGTAPAWGKLLRACGMAEVVTAGSMVEYTPVSDGFESLTIRYVVDGVLHAARGCRGTVKLDLSAYQIPKMSFTFWGYDTAAVVPASPPNSDLSAWQRPVVITDGNAGDVRLGASYTAAGNLSGGTSLVSRGIEIDLGNKLSHLKLLGGEEISISERDASGRMTVELSAADEVTWRDEMNADTLTSLGFAFGTTAGNKIVVHAPQVQRIDPQIEDYEGNLMFSTELRLLPLAGNDELTIAVK